MDTDLSLIEIAGEDDSLLQPIPGGAAVLNSVNGGRTSNATDYFLCSPLQIPRSKPKPIEAMAAIKENFSVETANKENFNMEKPEALKLSLEPQQMKRTRKGGGYNLRKSLAWDRAFFTEEGVLDASELSMISGDFSKSNGNPLSAIQEEVGCNSSGVKTRKENLIRKSPATKNVGASFLQKERSKEASTSVANRKVLSTHNVNRSGLKRSACPRTTASSSLKRPASSITTKASEKDSKVCKPVQKPHPAGPSRIGKSSIPSPVDPKRSQITRPGSNSVENTRKLFGFKESSSSSKGAQNNRKAGPDGKLLPTKTSFGQAKRNVSSVKGSCANVKIPLRTEATNPPCSSSGYGSRSIFDDGGSAKTAIPPSQHTETQTAKPTGLRMPSPSLGFFAQSTAVAQSPVKMISQPCKDPESNISHQRKFGIQTPVSTQKPPLPPRRLPKLQIDGTATESLKASNFCSGASSFINYISGTSEIMESKAQVNSVRLVEEKLKIGENGFEAFNDQIKLQSVNDRVDMTLNMNDKSVSQKPYEKLDKNNTDMKVVDGSLKGTKTSESKDSHESELNRCSEPCLLPGNLLDCEADAAKQVECQNLDDCKLDFIDSHQVSENDGSHDGTTLMESGNMEEDVHSGEDVIAMGQKSELAVLFLNDASAEHADHANNEDKELDPCSEIPRSNYYSHTKVKSCTEAVGQKSELEVLFQNGASAEHADYANNEDKERDPCSEIPSFNYDSQTEVKCSTEAVGQKSELEVLFQNDASAEHADHANNEDKELNPCSEIPSCNYNSQTKVKSCPERGNSLIKQDCVLGGEGNNVKNQEFQDQQMKNSSCENERIACGKNECPAIERLMFEEDTLSLEESKKLENGNTAGVYPEVSSDGSGLENLDSLLREKMDCMVRVSEDCNCVIKKQEESCEFQHSGNKTEEDSAVCVLGAGLGPISQDNQKNNAFEVNDFETVLDQGDDNDTELKISSPPTFQDDDAGQNKETEILEAEDSPTMEIQRSVKKLQFSSPKQEKENNLPEANSSEDMLDTKDEDAKSEQKNDDADKRHEGLVKKLPANLVPFSDEWLVALEAAGEEILMRKSGAVQNSPEERSEPKPGPWSPVKRKYHQALGPFDCTKHTNH